jgi:hypothetical protein
MDDYRGCVFINRGKFKPAGFQLFAIDNQSGIFHVKDLHHIPVPVHEYKHCSIPDILVHGRSNNTAQGVKAFAHIHRERIKKISQGTVKMKHILIHQGYQRSQSGQAQVGFKPKRDPVGIDDFKMVIIVLLWSWFV